MARTPEEKAIDTLLTLYLINDAFSRKKLRFLSETKLQKLVFLAEKSMIDDRRKGFNFYFIKLTHGPYSADLRNTLHNCLGLGFLDDFGLSPTRYTEVLLKDFQDIIARNGYFFQRINATNDQFARVALPRLLKIIYDMPWRNRTVADLPHRTPMLYPMKPHKIRGWFEITADEVEDLLMNFDPEAVKGLSQAMKEMKTERLRTREQVFSNL